MATQKLEIMAAWKLEIKKWLYLEIRNKQMPRWKLEIKKWLPGNWKLKDGYLEIIIKIMATQKLKIKIWLPRNYK